MGSHSLFCTVAHRQHPALMGWEELQIRAFWSPASRSAFLDREGGCISVAASGPSKKVQTPSPGSSSRGPAEEPETGSHGVPATPTGGRPPPRSSHLMPSPGKAGSPGPADTNPPPARPAPTDLAELLALGELLERVALRALGAGVQGRRRHPGLGVLLHRRPLPGGPYGELGRCRPGRGSSSSSPALPCPTLPSAHQGLAPEPQARGRHRRLPPPTLPPPSTGDAVPAAPA